MIERGYNGRSDHESSLVCPGHDRAFGRVQHSGTTTPAASAAAGRLCAAAAGDADVPGRNGDPDNGKLSGAAATPTARAARAAR